VKPPNEFQPAKVLVATSCQQAYGSAMSWNKQSLLALTTTQHTHTGGWCVTANPDGTRKWGYFRVGDDPLGNEEETSHIAVR
jgi:hypothetical protein